MFLDDTYFRGELYLPNLVKGDNNAGKAAILQTVGEKNLLWFVEKYEDEALGFIIGKELRDEAIPPWRITFIARSWPPARRRPP